MRNLQAVYDRIQARIKHVDSDCIICTYSTGSHGYAQAFDGVTTVLAHKIVWEYLYGPVPEDMTVDHECHVRICMNPKHLRLLPNPINAMDNGQIKIHPEIDKMCRARLHKMVKSSRGNYCRECKQSRRKLRRQLGLQKT